MINELSGKNVLVTGGTGSIGSELVNQLLNHDVDKVFVFSRDETKHFMLKKLINDERLETLVGDVRDYRSIQRVFDKFEIDIIYHSAAMKHVVVCEEFPMECAKTNVFGTQNVVDLALKYDVPKMITVSTDKSTHPVNAMGASKFIAETITLNANYSCVRFGNVANSRGSVIPVFIESIINRKPITITNPEVTRFIMEIPDAARLVLNATKYSKGGDLFILKMKAFRLGDLLDVIVNRVSPRIGISRDEIEINEIGMMQGEKLHEDLINSTEPGRLCELENMYVVLRNNEYISKYENIRKTDLPAYTSNDVELMQKDEIETIVMKYILSNPRTSEINNAKHSNIQ